MYEQQEYAIGWGLVILFLLLGLLAICIPRPRRTGLKPIDRATRARERAAAKRKRRSKRKRKR